MDDSDAVETDGLAGWTSPDAPPPAPAASGWVVASVGHRFGAYLLDTTILGALLVGLLGVLFVAMGRSLADSFYNPATMLLFVVFVGVWYAYFACFWLGPWKATPGMRLFKIQVTDAADGSKLALGPASRRWLALGGMFSPVVLFGELGVFLGYAAMGWTAVLLITTERDPMNQGLHDRWARSVVVRPAGTEATSRAWAVTLLTVVLIYGLMSIVPVVVILANNP